MIPKMQFQDHTAVYKKAIFNILTSTGLLIILHFSDAVQYLGSLASIYIPSILIVFELLKHLLFGGFGYAQYTQSHLSIKWIWNAIKSILLIAISIVSYFILAILYGAKAFSEHEETFMFAVHLTACTTIHCIVNMNSKELNAIFTKPSYGDQIVLNSAQVVTVCSIFGCWASAVVIPLDWERWWQKWPIPCVLGTYLGYICGFFMIIALAYINNNKKSTNQQRKKRCV